MMKQEILYSGPYSINNRLIILKPWTADFNFNEEFPTEIPLWVNFPQLPMNCWGPKSLSMIASALGIPMRAYEYTAKQKRVSYAIILIEINVTTILPDEITVMDPNGRTFQHAILYDWKQLFCEKCQVIGQLKKKEKEPQLEQARRRRGPKRIEQQWVSKNAGISEQAGPSQMQEQQSVQQAGMANGAIPGANPQGFQPARTVQYSISTRVHTPRPA